jgi:hypothetical protein
MAGQNLNPLKDAGGKAEREALLQIAKEVDQLFVIPASTDSLLAPIGALIPKAPLPLAQSVEAFCSSVRSVVLTAGLPYVFALTAARRRRRQLLQCAAELESALESDGRKSERPIIDAQDAHADADRRLTELEESRSGRDALNHEACHLLLSFATDDELGEALAQLILQAVVLTWSAFEVLSRDIFRTHLNCTPGAYTELSADADIRKRFDLSRVSIERVADFGFDLSSRLGDLLVEQNDLADLGGIKATFTALFPSDSRLRGALSERDLWLLFQRRSVIVHRCGITDQRYLDASGDQQPIGRRLAVRPRELKKHLESVTAAANTMISAAIRLPEAGPSK